MVLQAFSPCLVLVSIDMLLANAILATGHIKTFARVKVLAIVVTTLLEVFLVPLFQTRSGNGGLGVMFAIAGGELWVIAATLYILPTGTLQRESFGHVLRAAAAGVITIVAMRQLVQMSAFVTIPLTMLAFTVVARVLGLVTSEDASQIATLLGRRTTGPVPAAIT